jgi:N-hydroxyarylamine O-acetyltransferase
MDADLDAYFDRIRYDGPRAPTLATLQGIVAAHVAAIPFENLQLAT